MKPAVGAGSRDAASYGAEDLAVARALVQRLHEDDRSVILQPLLTSVAADGEWALVVLDGMSSHAASKWIGLPHAGAIGGSSPRRRRRRTSRLARALTV